MDRVKFSMTTSGRKGCCAYVAGGHRHCSQRAITHETVDGVRRGFCYYHDLKAPKKFGEGYK
jgi:hypothetical protein